MAVVEFSSLSDVKGFEVSGGVSQDQGEVALAADEVPLSSAYGIGQDYSLRASDNRVVPTVQTSTGAVIASRLTPHGSTSNRKSCAAPRPPCRKA